MNPTITFINFVVLVLVSLQSSAQNVNNYNNTWIFGDSIRLEFAQFASSVTTPNVTAVPHSMASSGGTSSISDGVGNLLFYLANPVGVLEITLYDRNFNPMPNGQNLLGNESASQGSVIVKDPENCNQFYVFYTSNSTNGLRYSKVDMTLNSGNGDVIPGQKDVLLFNTQTEKVTLAAKPNSKFFWVITRQQTSSTGIVDNLVAIPLLEGGTFGVPVISSFPDVGDNLALAGWMNFNTKFTKIADASFVGEKVHTYNFNSSTGAFSNRINIFTSLNDKPYGCAFSGDGNILYLSYMDNTVAIGDEILRRIDLGSDASGATYQNTNIGESQGFHAVQRSPKGLIYITAGGTNYLHVVNEPSNYSDPAITLNGLNTQNMVQGGLSNPFYGFDYFSSADLMTPDGSQQICYNTATTVGGDADSLSALYSWTGQVYDESGNWTTPSASYLINPNATNPTTVPLTSPITRFLLTIFSNCGDTIFTNKEFVLLDSLPTPTVSGTFDYCADNSIAPLTSSPPLVGSTYWYTDAQLTDLAATGSTITPPISSGSITYYVVEQESNNLAPLTCTSIPATVTVSINTPIPLCYTKEASQWYMPRNIGLNFLCSSPPIVLNDAVVPQPAGEGGVSISNQNGELKFYAFGGVVRNRNHAVMPNGAGLQTDLSSSQGAVAVPNPGHQNRYYLFTIKSGTDGLYYSEIDTTLDSGLGDVVVATKNTPLLPNVGEQITAVENCDGTGTWVIVHDADYMYAYLVTATGIAAPVVSPVPTIPQYLGQLMASPSGRHIAYSLYNYPCQLYTFNNETGEICHQETLPTSGYGCSFSNTGQYLYTNENYLGIYQYDVYAETVSATSTFIGNPLVFGTMGLGPDCKLYIFGLNAEQGTVINSPDSPGLLCDLEILSFPLSNLGEQSQYGTPNYIQSWFKDPSYVDPAIDAEFTFTTACLPAPAQFTNSSFSLSACPKYLWDFGDPASGANNTSFLENPSHIFTEPGTYIVTLTIEERCQVSVQSYPVTVFGPSAITITGDTTVCENFDVVLTASGGNTYAWYGPSWQSGGLSGNSATLINPGDAIAGQDNEGWYSVTVTDANGCQNQDSVFVNILPVPDFNISNDISTCTNNLTVNVNYTNGNIASYNWSTGIIPSVIGTTQSISYNPVAPSQVLAFLVDSEGCGSGAVATVGPIAAPAAPIIYTPNAWYCVGDNLTPINAASGSLWYNNAGLSNQVGVGVSFIPPVVLGETTYYLVDTTGNCVSQAASVVVEFTNCSYPCANNLMPNGDLESFSVCPSSVGQISNATNWDGYFADYYNCGFYAYPDFTPPHTDPIFGIFYNPQGSGYLGFGLNGNSFLYGGVSNQVHLDSCMEYTIQFRASTPRSENDLDNVLCIYGSDVPNPFNAGCGGAPATQLACLTLPSDIDPTWQLYTLTFTPPADFDYLVFAGNCPAPTPVGGWIMLDDVFLCGDCINPPIVVSVDEVNPETCAGADGTIGATISSCDTTLTYSWENTAIPGVEIAATATVLNLVAGNYQLTVTDANGCTSASLSGNLSNAGVSPNSISYEGAPFCLGANIIPVLLTGSAGGVYSAPAGLSINSLTGAINPSLSVEGTYIVNYSQNGCNVTTSVTINASPSATIAYDGGPFCTSLSGITVTQTGTTAGVYSVSSAGLTINPVTGAISPSESSSGDYIITYTIPANGSCEQVSATANVILVAPTNPVTEFSYNDTYCLNDQNPIPQLNSGFTPGGIFSSTSGLIINSGSGEINLTASNPGTYTITYSIEEAACASGGTSNGILTINPIPSLSISGDTGPCLGDTITLQANGASTYEWLSGSSATTSTINVSIEGPTTFSVAGTSLGCIDTISINVNPVTPPLATLTGDTLLCAGENTMLTAGGGSVYIWSDGSTGNILNFTSSTSQDIYVVALNGTCADTAYTGISVFAAPVAIATATPTIILNGSSSTLNVITPASNILWSPGSSLSCTSCTSPIASPSTSTIYTVTVVSAEGCATVDTISVVVDVNCGEVFPPDAFSPNDDGYNDQWCVYGNCFASFDLKIFDRWGNVIFESASSSLCWNGEVNGKIADTGVYIYQLNAKLINGTNTSINGAIQLRK